MILVPTNRPIYAAVIPVDLRKSFDTLAGWATEQLGHDVSRHCVVLFFNKQRTRCKMLFRDNTGLVLLCKRLDKGCFQLFRPVNDQQRSIGIELSHLARLLDGLEYAVRS